MADEEIADEDGAEDAPKKKSKLPLILGVVMLLAGGGGGFMAVKMGLLGGASHADDDHADDTHEPVEDLPPLAFVPLDPLVISLPANARARHLRFTAQLEVNPDQMSDVEAVKPRIIDILNGYLRAVAVEDLEDPTALMRLRAQMLRRIQVVAGDGRVRDLLIMEFVLN